MGAHAATRTADHGAGFVAVLRIRVFAVLFVAETQSIVGDQLARVALSVLVFTQTGSASATAATYAATLLPAVIGGLLLGRLGDRYPRRVVMIGCDVVRGACFAVMAVPGLPLSLVIGLVVVAVLLGPVFSATEVSYLSAYLDAEDFRVANALRMIAVQAAQVGGFVFGGIAVALLGPRVVLLLDSATFLVSVVLIAGLGGAADRRRAGTEAIVSPTPADDTAGPEPSDRATAGSNPWRDRRLMSLLVLSLLVGFFVVPEGLAVPFGDSTGAATWQVGLLLASGAAGGVTGAVLLVRLVRAVHRLRVAGYMAMTCGVPLVVTGLVQSWPIAAVCWFVSGVLAAYVVETNTIIVQAVPDSQRAAFVGAAGALLLGAQGLGLVSAGVIAQVMSPGGAIAVAGATGSALAVLLVLGPLRTARSEGRT